LKSTYEVLPTHIYETKEMYLLMSGLTTYWHYSTRWLLFSLLTSVKEFDFYHGIIFRMWYVFVHCS